MPYLLGATSIVELLQETIKSLKRAGVEFDDMVERINHPPHAILPEEGHCTRVKKQMQVDVDKIGPPVSAASSSAAVGAAASAPASSGGGNGAGASGGSGDDEEEKKNNAPSSARLDAYNPGKRLTKPIQHYVQEHW